MPYRFSRRTVIKSGAALAGLALAGCAPSAPAPQSTSGNTTNTGSSAQPTAAPSGPKKGGTVRIVYQAEPPHLDPTLQTSYATHGGLGSIFSRLIRYKTGPGVDFASRNLEPDLALSWQNTDPVTYMIKMRPDVKWHNKPPMNGRLFTADDAKWSLDFYKDSANKNVFRSMFDGIDNVAVVDKSTLKITLKEPQSFFIDNVLSSHYAKMLPPEVWEKDGSFQKTAIGTGPFMFDKWDRGVKMTFVRNPEYFEAGKPYVDGFEWLIQGDYATRLAMLRANEIDYGPEPTGPQYEDIDSVKQAQPNLAWDQHIRANMYWISMNLTKKPFNDPKVRQAVSLALDRKQIVDNVWFSDGVISSIMPPALTDWLIPQSEIDAKFGKRDVAKAKQLLAEAGYPNGFDTEFLPRESSGAEFSLCEVLVSMLKDVGINANMKILDRPQWTAALNSGDYQMAENLGQTSFEPDDWTYVLYHSKSPRNQAKFSDPKADDMLEKQRSILDVAERKKAIQDIQRYLNDVLPVVPVAYRYEHMPNYPYLKDFKVHWSYDLTYLTSAWLDK